MMCTIWLNSASARTFPANGRFSPAQTSLYSAVLQAQKYLITLCTESARLSLAQIHRESLEALRKELNKIGFNLDGVTGAGDLERILYPHYVGHPLGIGTSFDPATFDPPQKLSLRPDLHESAHFERNQP